MKLSLNSAKIKKINQQTNDLFIFITLSADSLSEKIKKTNKQINAIIFESPSIIQQQSTFSILTPQNKSTKNLIHIRIKSWIKSIKVWQSITDNHHRSE